MSEPKKNIARWDSKNGKLARDHGLPKMCKECSNIKKFRPIVDITGTPRYSVGKFLTDLLNTLYMSKFTLKDSFDAVNKIKNIPPHLFENGTPMYLLMWNLYSQMFPLKEPWVSFSNELILTKLILPT